MNIILVEPTEIQGGTVRLEDHRAEHIIKVLRSEVGDTVRMGEVDGNMGRAEVVAIKRKFPFLVELRPNLSEPPPARSVIDLVLALPRPIMLKRVLSQVTALGIGAIHLINANRVEKSFWESGVLEQKEYRLHLLHGLEQAVDTRLPKVVLHRRFRPFIEDYFPGIKADYEGLVCAHPEGGELLSNIIENRRGRILLAIGPEGGWVDYELDRFTEQNFTCCTIGERILKVDTAVVALHSRISALREQAGRVAYL